MFQVERDAALVGVEREEGAAPIGVRLGADERRLVARGIPSTGWLELDGVGALIGQQLGAKRARDRMGHLEHVHSRKYCLH